MKDGKGTAGGDGEAMGRVGIGKGTGEGRNGRKGGSRWKGDGRRGWGRGRVMERGQVEMRRGGEGGRDLKGQEEGGDRKG